MSISSVLSTAVSALAANSARVATSAQNIANVNTDGYLARESQDRPGNAAPAFIGGRALIAGTGQVEAVEPSNVNVAKEFMDMILAKAAYEANVQVVRTAEEMLQDAIDIKA